MTTPNVTPQVRHVPESKRFEMQAEGHVAELLYKLKGNTITFTHTGVPGPLEGRGIGSQLAHAGLEYARENGLKVVSTCWFVTGYIERHAEYQPLLKG
jgi:predicted GNAT family acetyltransferase